MTEERFQMRINVGATIFWIDVFMETGTVVNKCVQKVKFDGVLGIRLKQVEITKLDTMIKELKISFGSCLFIDENGGYFLALEINKKILSSLCKAKSNFYMTSELVGVLGQNNSEPIMHVTQDLPSRMGFSRLKWYVLTLKTRVFQRYHSFNF